MKTYGWIALVVLILFLPSGFYAQWINGGPISMELTMILFLVNVVVGGACTMVIINARQDRKFQKEYQRRWGSE